ncbi:MULTISPECIES: FAD-dependent monooxygenase [Pseudonocardia]|uniref:Pentachlorophenol 4-monooxygenase n=2 Tax=Pseudonocardia TaxID=1847 RepID=A0A1Y2N6J6_PSEAH|nr:MULTISPECIES: FAD-dependent monooxygenase [Pseudonocardia]OSY42791.1 Pentachlorophenol 4-monooxygenase [Pseudonocardia autotrophica]TDN77368.1 phenol 2-monooxygenase [Pseudonocardia autotrophica]BBG01392.1 phenol 2-monooxygenase [Pseudonocardia autotrophica]GEC24448.1 phenol 2-monooxygenase [Pseudonocardia saturnea]
MAQFYVDGYRPGDPFVAAEHPAAARRPPTIPATTDVLVVGTGPAGLVLAAQLAAFTDVDTVVVDRRDGPLEVGQADGVACRTVEMFEAFGLADRLIGEGYQVNEVAFWRPDPGEPDRIARTDRIPDVEPGLSEMPHMIVNQARLLSYLREYLARSPRRIEPYYGLHLTAVEVDDAREHPVEATLAHVVDGVETGETTTVRARYVVGCDGSRSSTRSALGLTLEGDSTDTSWGVMDVLVETDFPDIRLKCAVQSADQGSILVIPREGGYLVRLYIELDNERDREMLTGRSVTPEKLAAVANRILHPYTLTVHDVGWWSVYEIGQRLCSRFDDAAGDDPDAVPRVFIAGDACHTHSAKAGQGMNVSMADAWNLGWKLGAVLRGRARPALLRTYSAERQAVAQQLIDFDREFATLFSAAPDADPEKFQRFFREQGRYTAGMGVRYAPSVITAAMPAQHLASGFEVGTRFHSAPVVRLADARALQLGHVARADGAWRLYVFADRAGIATGGRLHGLCARLSEIVRKYTPAGDEPDSVLDVRAVLQQHHHDVETVDLPAVLRPRKGRFGLVDHEKVFCPDPASGDVFDLRGIDREAGCLVLVRPDQYIAHVVGLDAPETLDALLAGALAEAG